MFTIIIHIILLHNNVIWLFCVQEAQAVSIVVPVVYNITQNQTSLASLQKELNNSALHAVQQHLSRWAAANMSVPGTNPPALFIRWSYLVSSSSVWMAGGNVIWFKTNIFGFLLRIKIFLNVCPKKKHSKRKNCLLLFLYFFLYVPGKLLIQMWNVLENR